MSIMSDKNVTALIKNLESYCSEHGLRYTPPRYQVLQVIAGSTKPVGAYDIIEDMDKITDKPKPTTVYRAIDFLQQHGFIHKIESMNAFVVCHAGHSHDGSQFIVCDDCGKVEEVHLCHLPSDLERKVNETGFTMMYWNTEIHGRCDACRA